MEFCGGGSLQDIYHGERVCVLLMSEEPQRNHLKKLEGFLSDKNDSSTTSTDKTIQRTNTSIK